MSIKIFCIVIGVGLTGGATALLTSATTREIATESVVHEMDASPSEEVLIESKGLAPQIEVMAVDMNTNEVIAEYPSTFDASVLTNIPEDAVLNSIMVSEGIEGVYFVYK